MSAKTAPIPQDLGLLIPVRDPGLPITKTLPPKAIRSSPYHERDHWLDLETVDVPYRILALALQSFHNVHPNYAREDYHDSFNVPEIVELVRQYAKVFKYPIERMEAYVIAFRSSLHEHVHTSSEKRAYLCQVDKDSHREANISGGLLKYWYGVPDDTAEGRNLATCWWTDSACAQRGGRGRAHREGVATVRGWYQYWQVEEYSLVITPTSYEFIKLNEN